MATLNEVIRGRRALFRTLKRSLRVADSLLEKQERKIQSTIDRRRKVPEDADLEDLVNLAIAMLGAVEDYVSVLNTGYPL